MANPTVEEIENSSEPKSEEELLSVMRQRLAHAMDFERDIRTKAKEDTLFVVGEQWNAQDKADRETERRPCLTINRMPQAVRQVTNDARQNRPAIRVSPVDNGADVKTAKIRQGLIRNIETISNAPIAYDRALAPAVRGGIGFFRIVAGYFDPLSFYQELRIKSVQDPDTCYLDPNYTEIDGSDAEWGFAFEDMSEAQFKKLYPNAKLCSHGNWSELPEDYQTWIREESVRVADYYFKEWQEKQLFLLSDGNTALEDELPKVPGVLAGGVTVVAERKTLVPIVHHVKSNGYEELERTIWPGRYIPIVPVLGEEIVVGGKRILEGLVRHAKDSQRMYNYWASAETETIALAPKAPWVGAVGQFKSRKAQWETANRKNHSFLEYDPVSANGQLAPPPQRNVQEAPVQAITQARMLAADDIKSTTGIYDSALGAKSNETSGIAIRSRASQAQTSNFHFYDNLSRSIAHGGRILNDAISIVYDAARVIRILGEEDQEELVKINQDFQYKGDHAHFRMDVGKYDVSVSTGPSYESKRQEAAQGMLDFTRSLPQAAAVIPDLIAKNLDWPGADEMANRLKKTLPPGIAEDDKNQPLPPQAQAQMQQMNQMIEQLTAQLNDANGKIETKTLELESRERIEMAKLQMQAEIELAKLGSAEAIELLRSEISQIEGRLNLLRQHEPVDPDSQIENQPPGPEGAGVGMNEPQAGFTPQSMEDYP